jgi:hypothetical protein
MEDDAATVKNRRRDMSIGPPHEDVGVAAHQRRMNNKLHIRRRTREKFFASAEKRGTTTRASSYGDPMREQRPPKRDNTISYPMPHLYTIAA